MLLNLLLRLRQVDPKRIAIAVLIVAFSATLAYIRLQSIERDKIDLVYRNPRTIERVRVIKKIGPVRIVTKIVERPGGEKETTVIEDRAPVEETTSRDAESSPAPISLTMTARSDRWVLGSGLLNFSPRASENWTAYAGYGFRNRFDLLYGLSYDNRINQSILLLVRF